MEFWIAFTVTFIIGMLYTTAKKSNAKSHTNKQKAHTTPKKQLNKADAELITVVLPTINNDK